MLPACVYVCVNTGFLYVSGAFFLAFNLVGCIQCQIIKNAKPGYEC